MFIIIHKNIKHGKREGGGTQWSRNKNTSSFFVKEFINMKNKKARVGEKLFYEKLVCRGIYVFLNNLTPTAPSPPPSKLNAPSSPIYINTSHNVYYVNQIRKKECISLSLCYAINILLYTKIKRRLFIKTTTYSVDVK